MAKSKDITEFYKGETVQFSVEAKDRTGAALDLTGATVYLSVAAAKINEGALTVQWTEADPQVTVTDAAGGLIDVNLSAADLNALDEGSTFHYGIWTYTASGVRLLQALGTIILASAVQPQP